MTKAVKQQIFSIDSSTFMTVVHLFIRLNKAGFHLQEAKLFSTQGEQKGRFDCFDRMALDGIRMADGCYADGTWELKMHVTDLKRDVSLRITGEIHIGGVMLKLVEKLGKMSNQLHSAYCRCIYAGHICQFVHPMQS